MGMLPWKILKLSVAKDAIFSIHFGGQSGTENELFMIIKLDEASSDVSPFKYYFLLETASHFVSLNVLLYVDNPVTDVSCPTNS